MNTDPLSLLRLYPDITPGGACGTPPEGLILVEAARNLQKYVQSAGYLDSISAFGS